MISPAMAKTLLGIDVTSSNSSKKDADAYEVHPEKPVIKITVNGKSIELPAMIIPGMHPNTIAVAVGYGRMSSNADLSMDRIGRSASETGKNAYPLLIVSGNTVSFNAPCTVEKTAAVFPLAQTQVHLLNLRFGPNTTRYVQRGLAFSAAVVMAWRLHGTLTGETNLACCH